MGNDIGCCTVRNEESEEARIMMHARDTKLRRPNKISGNWERGSQHGNREGAQHSAGAIPVRPGRGPKPGRDLTFGEIERNDKAESERVANGKTNQDKCKCGNVFMPDATFCRMCGAARGKPSREFEHPNLLEGQCKYGKVFMSDAAVCKKCANTCAQPSHDCEAEENRRRALEALMARQAALKEREVQSKKHEETRRMEAQKRRVAAKARQAQLRAKFRRGTFGP